MNAAERPSTVAATALGTTSMGQSPVDTAEKTAVMKIANTDQSLLAMETTTKTLRIRTSNRAVVPTMMRTRHSDLRTAGMTTMKTSTGPARLLDTATMTTRSPATDLPETTTLRTARLPARTIATIRTARATSLQDTVLRAAATTMMRTHTEVRSSLDMALLTAATTTTTTTRTVRRTSHQAMAAKTTTRTVPATSMAQTTSLRVDMEAPRSLRMGLETLQAMENQAATIPTAALSAGMATRMAPMTVEAPDMGARTSGTTTTRDM